MIVPEWRPQTRENLDSFLANPKDQFTALMHDAAGLDTRSVFIIICELVAAKYIAHAAAIWMRHSQAKPHRRIDSLL